MDRERKKRIRTIKLIVTEIIMTIVVVAAVIVLTFVAMGYNVNKDGDLAQSGLLQVRSIPSGATVEIDDEVMLAHTNMSKMLSAGNHNLKLSKEGYDTWSKEITAESGWLLKIEYPRLFLKDRTMEKVREYDNQIENMSFSEDGSRALYNIAGDRYWTLLDIASDDISETKLNLEEALGSNVVREIFWNDNNEKVLMRTKNSDKNEWILVNLKNPSESFNVTQEFGLDFSKVRFLTGAGDRLVTLENNNLRIITVNGKTVSGILASSVDDFYNDGTTLAYVGNYTFKDYAKEQAFLLKESTESESDGISSDTPIKAIMIYQDSAEDVFVAGAKSDRRMQVALSEYLGKKYLMIALDNSLLVYRGEYPNSTRQGLADMELILEEKLTSVPDALTVWSDEQLMMARNGAEVAMFDAELSKLSQYTLGSDMVFIVSDYLLGNIVDGKLSVLDFDGQNLRELAKTDSSAVISRNNKWLYYDLTVDGKTNIFREKIIE
ncbi:PEGA domain-containing protein [Candidatus Saccharibacteria bacterium]|nr:PEGA domain-containing protein [Candidatus Saccharibacteria bacterium]